VLLGRLICASDGGRKPRPAEARSSQRRPGCQRSASFGLVLDP